MIINENEGRAEKNEFGVEKPNNSFGSAFLFLSSFCRIDGRCNWSCQTEWKVSNEKKENEWSQLVQITILAVFSFLHEIENDDNQHDNCNNDEEEQDYDGNQDND